ncbi:PREDICTED: bromodomain-containing protein 8 [Polistes dominula]|uniref:Bromodomain-containing protein 8 n=1 Tax=Polistes dominula TaxID=743375 RepID=A0ABM1IGX0_POLDO|nr:PREDICTED: bromodomain-containing protein 8 [Polistes dominula]
MTSVQDRLKFKRISCDTWTTREQLCLASSVVKSGDQNWMSVSRSLKPFAEKEALRPPDWFSQKSCAIQYAYLLENADAPKRKKRESGETAGESIVKRLTQDRMAELGQILAFQRDEYQQLKAEVNLLKSGSLSEEKLQKMWHAIEQEERDQEQKARAHSAWLAKRQQKQEIMVSQNVPVRNQRKVIETSSDLSESTDVSMEDDEKKGRGGRSPLLTSLLKSPSPTTQIQTSTSTAQINSPTITSLLGSSPKVPISQITQSVTSSMHQMVPSPITNVIPERPSVGAPTLSMLLEMPANAQRGPLPNLQVPSTIVSQQQNVSQEVPNLQNPVSQTPIQNEVVPPATLAIPATTNIQTAAESMVQIIDHIDDVIRKDIMADVIDKDEINEIIGDIEELIKEEITGSPQTLESVNTNTVINSLTIPQTQDIPQIPERPKPRDVDEAVSLSDSPHSEEMAIEEIDSSTSNIAEIIGTAIEPSESKVIIAEISENVSNSQEEEKSEANNFDERVIPNEEVTPEVENNVEDNNKANTTVEEKQIIEDLEILDSVSNVETEESDSKTPDVKETVEGTIEEEIDEVEEEEMIVSEKEESCDNTKEQKESSEELENKECLELDQLELHLAKITGEQQDVPSAEAASVSSEVTNDVPSIEDTEKSQDISLILEDDESSHSIENKKKIVEEQVIENTIESTESLESFKEEPIILIKEKTIIEVAEELSVKSQDVTAEDTLEIYTDEYKKEERDFSEDTVSSTLPGVEIKEEMEEIEESTIAVESCQDITSEEIIDTEMESVETKTKNIFDAKNIEIVSQIKQEPKTEEIVQTANSFIEEKEMIIKEEHQIKEEKDLKKCIKTEPSIKQEITTESVVSAGEETAELDEEESSLSKLSGGRAMKTYSKKQTITVDSETENESTGEGADYRAWKKAVMLVYNRLATHKYASVFLRPITEDQAPGYHSVIFRPMDLSTIKKNIDNGTIRSTTHFQRDVMLMFQNAIMYNKHDTFIYKMAVSMQEECLQHMQILVQATGEGTFRRETRTAASSSIEISENCIKRKRSHITPSPHDTDSPRSKKRRKSEND